MAPSTEPTKYYRIAVNGASAAANLTVTMSSPSCTPTPEAFIGFQTSDEAAKGQQVLLTAPLKEVRKRLKEWMKQDNIKVIFPDSPEPPTQGQSLWHLTPQSKEKININLDFSVMASVSEVRKTIGQHVGVVDQCEGCSLSINGYDDGPRELWDMPEVVSFFRMLIEEGVLGILKMPKLANPASVVCEGSFGAMEVFLIANGYKLGHVIVNKNLIARFWAGVEAGNQIISERYYRV